MSKSIQYPNILPLDEVFVDFSQDAVLLYTNGAYEERNPAWHSEHSPWKAGKIAGTLKANKIEFRSACEIGCGAGQVLSELSKFYSSEDKTYTGFDISPQAINRARTLETDHLKFVLGSPFASDKNYDLVLIIDVIEHVENCMDFMRQIRPCGKTKVFHIPLDLSAQIILRSKPLLKAREEAGHIHYFTKDIALQLFRETGYRVIDWNYTDSSLSFPSGWKGRIFNTLRALSFRFFPHFTVKALGGWSLLVIAE